MPFYLLWVAGPVLEPLRIDGGEQAACMDLLDKVWDKWENMSPERRSIVKSTIHFEDHYPAYRRFRHGPSGTLWIQQIRLTSDLTAEEVEAERGVFPWPYGANSWDVFDAEGRYLGVVGIPGELGLPLFYGDRLYGIWRDEMDVQHRVSPELNQSPATQTNRSYCPVLNANAIPSVPF